MKTKAERKPMKVGLDYIRGRNWAPRLFTRKAAQRFMDRQAGRSALQGVPGCTGLVADCGGHWRGNVAAYPRT